VSKISWVDGLSSIESHSQAKHLVLETYLRRYFEVRCAPLQLDNFKITLVDGFAGGGMYRLPDGQPWRGSPLIMLHVVHQMQAAERARRQKKSFSIDARFIFVERNPAHARTLREQIRLDPVSAEFEGRIEVVEGAIEEKLDTIIAKAKAHSVKSGTSLFFLDPFGYDGALPLARRVIDALPKAEIILNFMVDDLINFLSNTESMAQILARNHLQSVGALLPSLTELKSEDDWRAPIQFLLHKDIWQQSHARFFTPFYITREGANRAYWLVHLSGAVRARDVMIGVHWEVQNCSMHYGAAGLDMFGASAQEAVALGYRATRDDALLSQRPLFQFDAQDRVRTMSGLMEDIPRKLREAGGSMTLAEFFNQHCNFTPANLGMLREATGQLLGTGELEEIVGPAGEVRRTAGAISDADRIVLRKQQTLF